MPPVEALSAADLMRVVVCNQVDRWQQPGGAHSGLRPGGSGGAHGAAVHAQNAGGAAQLLS